MSNQQSTESMEVVLLYCQQGLSDAAKRPGRVVSQLPFPRVLRIEDDAAELFGSGRGL